MKLRLPYQRIQQDKEFFIKECNKELITYMPLSMHALNQLNTNTKQQQKEKTFIKRPPPIWSNCT
jgi:hypothetical protein